MAVLAAGGKACAHCSYVGRAVPAAAYVGTEVAARKEQASWWVPAYVLRYSGPGGRRQPTEHGHLLCGGLAMRALIELRCAATLARCALFKDRVPSSRTYRCTYA